MVGWWPQLTASYKDRMALAIIDPGRAGAGAPTVILRASRRTTDSTSR